MLQVHQISKSYGVQTILDQVTFSINPNDRVGLVGPNGSGKSTLLRIVTHEEEADGGTVYLASTDSLGYLPQGLDLALDDSVGGYIRSGVKGLAETHARLESLTAQLTHDHAPVVLEAYGEALSQFESLNGYTIESDIASVMEGLGLGDVTQ